jgi:hypothetical protein
MAISQNLKSLSDAKVALFTNVKTSVDDWAKEDAAAAAELARQKENRERLQRLQTTYGDNNLDLSWDGARVVIVDKKAENALQNIIRNEQPHHSIDSILNAFFQFRISWDARFGLGHLT